MRLTKEEQAIRSAAFNAAWEQAERAAVRRGEDPDSNDHSAWALNAADRALADFRKPPVRFPNGQVVGERQLLA